MNETCKTGNPMHNIYVPLVQIEGRGLCGLTRMAFTMALVVNIDDAGNYGGRYCYPLFTDAFTALLTWDGTGDPAGNWIKYKGEGGERRNPNYNLDND